MTQENEALDKLIEAAEGGEALPMDGGAYRLFGDGWLHVFDAYNGSLDAAKALHEALLPGWWVQHIGHNLAGWGVRLETKGVSLPESCLLPRHACPARAWLLSILKAYRAQQEG